MVSCIQAPPPPPPQPEELKHIELVTGWSVTRDLEQRCKSVYMARVSRYDDWWAIHRQAYELKANVAQLVFDCQYDCEVRFWACSGKAAAGSPDKFGDLIGTISEINGKEVIVGGKNIGEKALMGTVFAVDAGDKVIHIEVTFPMMTLAKCKVKDGSVKDLKAGMKVYSKKKK